MCLSMRKYTHPSMIKGAITALVTFILPVIPRKGISGNSKLMRAHFICVKAHSQSEERECGCKRDGSWHDTHGCRTKEP